MMPRPSVLIGLGGHDTRDRDWRSRVAGWVRRWGYEAAVTDDGPQALAWTRERAFAASLVECGLVAETGESVWRTVRPIVGRRLVLMAREPGKEIWFEALRAGVGAVLLLPPEEVVVRAALLAATGAPLPGLGASDRRA